MTEEKSNQEEREEEDIFADEPETSNESEGDSSEADESADEALAVYNQQTGKNFKSWEDVKKSTREADKLFAKGAHKEAPEKRATVTHDDEVVEELLLTKHPEAENVLDELKDIAKQKGVSILKLYRESKYFQGEAKAIAESKKAEAETRSKVNVPSSGMRASSNNFKGMSYDEAKKLSDDDFLKWSEANQ